jgi:hypothetical protein
MRSRIVMAAAGGAVVLSLAGFGIASAAIPDGSGVIHACYQSPPPAHGANLQVIDTGAGGSCAGGAASITWSQQGPTGPQGATGPTGATGAMGAAGPSTAGSSGLDTQIVRATGQVSATATCPSDHPYVLGGGGYDANGPFIGNSYPDSAPGSSESETGTGPHAWTVNAESGFNDTMVAYAICSK